MRILFTRHAESEANVERIISNRNLPHKLTQVGVAQSVALAEILVGCCNVRMIYASPILRAKETASVVAGVLGLSITACPALREFDCGIMEGRGDDQAWVAQHAIIHAWDEEHGFDQRLQPDGESFNDMKARFVPFVTQLIQENKALSGDILLISHGGILHQMLPLVIENIDRAFTKQHPLENCELVITQHRSNQLLCSDWGGKKLK